MKFGCVGKEDYMSYDCPEIYERVVGYFCGFVESLSVVYEYCVVASSLQIQNSRITTAVHKFLN